MISNNGIVDDVFSKPIPLGFSFCFYDENYDKIVIGSNGILTFDLSEAESNCPSGISGPNPSPGLIDEAIFAVQHDMQFDENKSSEIYYETIGTAPNRKFIVNFYKAINFGCNDKSNIQVVLSELTNEIDVYIKDKPMPCPSRQTEAMLGITNKNNIKGISPPNRNKGIWGAHNEAWKFKPNGNKEPIITWVNSKNITVAEGQNVTVCPRNNEVYTAIVHYQSCINSDFKYKDDINVTFESTFPSIKKDTIEVCDVGNDGQENIVLNNYIGEILLNRPNDFNISFYATKNNALLQTSPITNWELPNNAPVYIRVENKQDTNCVTIHPIKFKFLTTGLGQMKIETCDNDNDNVENDFSIREYFKRILSNYNENEYSFYSSKIDAENEVNQIDIINLTLDSQIYLKINSNSGCDNIFGAIPIKFNPAPEKYKVDKIIFKGCDNNYNNIENFDWSSEIKRKNPKIPLNITINAFYNKSDAYDPDKQGVDFISSLYQVVFIRFKNPSGCFTVIEVEQEIDFTFVAAKSVTKYICFDGKEDIIVNLEDYIPEMLDNNSNPNQVNYKFYSSNANAQNNVNPIFSNQNIVDDGYFVSKTFYVRFDEGLKCYTVRPLTINLVHPEPLKNPINVCDIFNDNGENNILSIYDNLILGDQQGNVTYYLNEADAIADQNAIVKYRFTTNVTLYIRIESHNCVEIYPITFKLSEVANTNNIDEKLDAICDDGTGYVNVNLTIYEDKIYNGNVNPVFTYYKSYNPETQSFIGEIIEPEKFPINTTTTIYVKISIGATDCMAVATITLRVVVGNQVTLNTANLYQCDFAHDLNEEFDLPSATDQLIKGNQNLEISQYEITYYSNKKAAEDGNVNYQLPNKFKSNSSLYIVYVRFESKLTGCFHIGEIKLHTIPVPKPISGSIKICDNNANGLYDLDLTKLNDIVIGYNNDFTFSYYLNEADAKNSVNPLDTNQIYEPNSFPNKIWVRAESIKNCYDIAYVDIILNTLSSINITELKLYACNVEKNQYATFNLEESFSQLPPGKYSAKFFKDLATIENFGNEIPNPKTFKSSIKPIQTIYAYISENDKCPIVIPLKLESIAPPEVEIISEVKFCKENSFNITPKINNQNNFTFEWTDPKGNIISNNSFVENIETTGTYTLTIRYSAHPECFKTYTVEAIHYTPPQIKELKITNNNIEIIAIGDYQMEYSYDGINWQNSNIFTNLTPGIYTFLVRYSIQRCLGESAEGIILNIYNVITPNDDNINDNFIIKDLNIFDKESTLFIYDKYGKLLHKHKSNIELKWNGKINGRNVPTGNYWYIVELPDGRKISGNIILKNY